MVPISQGRLKPFIWGVKLWMAMMTGIWLLVLYVSRYFFYRFMVGGVEAGDTFLAFCCTEIGVSWYGDMIGDRGDEGVII